MKRFFRDLIHFRRYLLYSVKADLKGEVANSRISWMWWILDPVCFMLIYSFIYLVVFGRTMPHFIVFVFIGLTMWKFFSKMLSGSINLVRNNKSVLCRVYLPKWVLSLEKMGSHLFKMMISWALVAIVMVIDKVQFSFMLLHMIPILFVLMTVSFGLSTILLHFGVFVQDLKNITDIVLKIAFYLSGVFFDIFDRVPAPWNTILLKANPAAFLMEMARNVVIDQKCPSYLWLGFWFAMGVLLSVIGVSLIYRHENNYAKVM